MGRVVAKFGGTSLANSDQFRKVKSIITADEKRKFIVPSAPGKRHGTDFKITDIFYLCTEHVKQGIPFDDVFRLIEERYIGLKHDLGINVDIEIHLKEVKEALASGKSTDYAASRGEYLNGILLADFLGYEFVDAAEVIKFNTHGRVDLAETEKKFKERVNGDKGYVIPGFYGVMPNGEIKTFSRGGSDMSGAIVARCVGASLYENWTDVSGFLMADPRIVENPKPIDKITYKELRELSYMGATVLHEDCIFPIKDVGIPINIKNTNKPEDEGTFIISDMEPIAHMGNITGIAGKKGFTVITIQKTLMNAEHGYCRKLLSILETNGISFESMPAGIDSVSLVIADSELGDKLEIVIREIENLCSPDSIEVLPNMALVATVGNGMSKTVGVSSKVFTGLAAEKINIRMINQGSSEINIIVGVENEDFENAVRGIYKAFQ
jgi:aspartate kinase